MGPGTTQLNQLPSLEKRTLDLVGALETVGMALNARFVETRAECFSSEPSLQHACGATLFSWAGGKKTCMWAWSGASGAQFCRVRLAGLGKFVWAWSEMVSVQTFGLQGGGLGGGT